MHVFLCFKNKLFSFLYHTVAFAANKDGNIFALANMINDKLDPPQIITDYTISQKLRIFAGDMYSICVEWTRDRFGLRIHV